ncbi:glucosamine kinase [Mycolicibacterium obuense]|uniref:glucosamine kinase n=1 Tax=Mycolicibacterium obuense TaxID=1807 RepID=UPI0023F6845B|nr:glucosamine kinase [Mycolicibacterium obuense]
MTTLPDPVDWLDLSNEHRLAIVAAGSARSALPMARRGGWHRARPGEGASTALLRVLAAQPGDRQIGRFHVRSWAARPLEGERAMNVDQTNESVIVGDQAVVKWAVHLQEGPHPAPQRITTLRDAGFTGIPQPWGVITWQAPNGEETVTAYVDEYLPGAVDGWTWAVEMMTAATLAADPDATAATARQLGVLVADMHSALAATASTASSADAHRWHMAATALLETACAITGSASAEVLRAHRAQVVEELALLASLTGAAVLDGHGDLHVGQVLRSDGKLFVTDFDGNPVLTAAERMHPIPAVVDVAGMVQSLVHVAIVARRYTALDPGALHAVEAATRRVFVQAYTARLTAGGHGHLFEPRPLRALRLVQVMREMIYAAQYLPRWMYVPDAALPALLDDEE